MKKQPLFNKINRELLKKDLLNETFERVTVSFYKFIHSDEEKHISKFISKKILGFS